MLVGGILLITAIAVLGEAVANDWAVIWRSIREHRTQGLRSLVPADFSIRGIDTGPFCPDLSCQASSHNALAVDLLDDVIQGKRRIAEDIHMIDRTLAKVKGRDLLDAGLIEPRQGRPLGCIHLPVCFQTAQIPAVDGPKAAFSSIEQRQLHCTPKEIDENVVSILLRPKIHL